MIVLDTNTLVRGIIEEEAPDEKTARETEIARTLLDSGREFYIPVSVVQDLATSAIDNHAWVLGAAFGTKPVDVGPIASFVATAGCAQ